MIRVKEVPYKLCIGDPPGPTWFGTVRPLTGLGRLGRGQGGRENLHTQMTEHEIAGELGISASSVSQHLFGKVRGGKRVGGAIPKLRQKLKGRAGEERAGEVLSPAPFPPVLRSAIPATS